MLPLVPGTSSTRCVGVERFRAADQQLEQAEDCQYLGYRSTKHGPVESRVAATQKQRHRCYYLLLATRRVEVSIEAQCARNAMGRRGAV